MRRPTRPSWRLLIAAAVITAGTVSVLVARSGGDLANEGKVGTKTPAPLVKSATSAASTPASSPSATSTATPTPAAGAACAKAVWSSSAALGQWATNGFLLNNNKWNTDEAGPQAIYACGYDSWYVVSNQPALANNPGSIKTYPDVQKNFNQTIDSFSSIQSNFAQSAPSVGEWNFAYDIWLNGLGHDEVMVWTQHRYNGPLPPGSAVESAAVTIGGQSYKAWRRGSSGHKYIALVMDPQKSAGSVDLLKVFDWLVSKGWLSGSDRVSAIEYGVEIASTGGGPQTFRVNSYDLTTR